MTFLACFGSLLLCSLGSDPVDYTVQQHRSPNSGALKQLKYARPAPAGLERSWGAIGCDQHSTEHSTNGGFSVAQLLYCLGSRSKGVSPVERAALTYLVQSSAAAGVHLMLQQLRRTR